eukprot:635615-Rhodomonas_salina.1
MKTLSNCLSRIYLGGSGSRVSRLGLESRVQGLDGSEKAICGILPAKVLQARVSGLGSEER